MKKSGYIFCFVLIMCNSFVWSYYGGIIRAMRFTNLTDYSFISRSLIKRFKLIVVAENPERRFVAYFIPINKTKEYIAVEKDYEKRAIIDQKNIRVIARQEVTKNDVSRLAAGRIYHRTGNLAYILRYYPKVEEISDWLFRVNHWYKTRCELIDIGISSEGKPITVVKISTGGSGKPAVWIDAGLHGREWTTVASSLYLIYRLVVSADKIPAEKILKNYDIYILPIANPDGYDYSHKSRKTRMWRKSRRKLSDECFGVDLNRNFPFKWAADSSKSSPDPCSDLYRGSEPLSEPESKAIAEFLLNFPGNLSHYVTLHSYAQSIMIPWSYKRGRSKYYNQQIDVSRSARESIYKTTGRWYKIGTVSEVMYPTGGGSLDWAQEEVSIPTSLAIELPPGGRRGRYGFIVPLRDMRHGSKDVWAAVARILEEEKESCD